MSDQSSSHGLTYRAFISYSHRDKAWADWLHKALETYRVPPRLIGEHTNAGVVPRRLNPVFRDREELSSSPELGSKIDEALAQSANLIVLCSPASATSRWVNEEVLAYQRMGRSGHIFCLIVDGEPDASDLPGRESEECFCPALRFQIGADGRSASERTEPIAADARHDKDGKANAKLKLIAGMLGVGFDALKQREQHRRMRRMLAVTTLAVAVMAVTIVLAVFALLARHTAVIAQQQAIVAQQAAERRQKQAEGLVDFMLGDLYDKLEQVNRLDVMQAVDDKAMAYFATMPTADATPTALAQRARALTKIGMVRQGQGYQTEALVSFEAAGKLAAGLATANPTDASAQLQYARILTFIGVAHWTQGQLDAAQRHFDKARSVLQGVASHPAHDLERLYALETIDNDLGHVYEARGQLDAAAAAYRSALDSSEKLVAVEPGSAKWQSELGGAHNNLGKVALLHGDLATAIAEYAADETIESSLSARDARDNTQKEATLAVRAILGRTLALAGNDRAGIQYLRQAVRMATELVKVDPQNAGFLDDEALYSTQLARLQRLNGNLPVARTLTARSLSILVPLVHQDPTNSYFQSDLAAARTEQAAQSLAQGHAAAARQQAGSALHALEPLLARQPDDRGLLLARLQAQLLLAETHGALDAGARLHGQIVAAVQAQNVGTDDPRLLALHVQALLGLKQDRDAQPLVQRLWKSGYRDAALLAALRRAHIAYPVNTAFQKKLPPLDHAGQELDATQQQGRVSDMP